MQIPVNIIFSSEVKDGEIELDKVIIKARMSRTFDIKSSKEWSVFFKTIINSGLAKILIDMSALNHIESSSMGILINLAKATRAKKGDIVFLDVPEDIEEIFKMVHMHRFIRFFSSEEEALNFFNF